MFQGTPVHEYEAHSHQARIATMTIAMGEPMGAGGSAKAIDYLDSTNSEFRIQGREEVWAPTSS